MSNKTIVMVSNATIEGYFEMAVPGVDKFLGKRRPASQDSNLYIPIDMEADIVGVKGLPLTEEMRQTLFGEQQSNPKPVSPASDKS